KMVSYMEKNKDIGVLGPQLVYASGKIQESCRRHMSFFDLVLKRTFLGGLPFFKARVDRYLMQDVDFSKVQDTDTLTGAAMLIPRAVWEKIRGFDERYFLFMEDLDLCRMVKKAGFRVVYYPDVKLEHYQKRLSDGSLFKTARRKVFWLHVASALKYFSKWRKE
ncbi:glycosyltransferase, partial [Patescibacteria group bacterium]|nr:glycosyltransferase [Patescibacteria group bacterium]